MIEDAEKLKGASLFFGLAEAEVLRFLEEAGAVRQNYAKGEYVCVAGAVARDLGLVMIGQVVSKSFAPGGDALTFRVYEPCDPIGLDALYSRKKTFPRDVIAQRDSSVLWMPFAEAAGAGKPESHLRKILKGNMDMLLAEELIRSDYKNEVLAGNRVTLRLFTHLKIVAAKHGTREVEINMTQTELAEYLCVSRPALTRAIAELCRHGKIEIAGKKIRIR